MCRPQPLPRAAAACGAAGPSGAGTSWAQVMVGWWGDVGKGRRCGSRGRFGPCGSFWPSRRGLLLLRHPTGASPQHTQACSHTRARASRREPGRAAPPGGPGSGRGATGRADAEGGRRAGHLTGDGEVVVGEANLQAPVARREDAGPGAGQGSVPDPCSGTTRRAGKGIHDSRFDMRGICRTQTTFQNHHSTMYSSRVMIWCPGQYFEMWASERALLF